MHREVAEALALKARHGVDGAALLRGEHGWDLVGDYLRKIEMDADEARCALLGHGRRDERAPVTALSAVPAVAQPRHERCPAACDALGIPAGRGRLVREGESRKRRDDEIERVARLAAVDDGVGQRSDHLQEIQHRARPAVRDDQRQRARMRRPNMQEVDGQAVYLHAVLIEAVEPCFAAPPVIAAVPVIDPGSQPRFGHTLRPA